MLGNGAVVPCCVVVGFVEGVEDTGVVGRQAAPYERSVAMSDYEKGLADEDEVGP